MGTRLGEEVDIKISLASGDSVVCQRWYSGAYPKGDGVTSADWLRHSSDENYRIGSLLVSVEGEPKSFLPPALFLLWSKSILLTKKRGRKAARNFLSETFL